MYRILFMVFLSFLLCSGCAMTMENVRINYNTPHPQAVNPILKGKLYIGKIQDKRGVEDPSIIIHKTNLHGQTTSGGYKAESPLCDIVQRALQDYFSKYEIKTDSNKEFELYGSLMDFKYDSISGWFSVKLKPELIIKLYLKDISTDKVVCTETFFGRGLVEKFSGSQDGVNKMFQSALDDFLRQLSSSELLKNYI